MTTISEDYLNATESSIESPTDLSQVRKTCENSTQTCAIPTSAEEVNLMWATPRQEDFEDLSDDEEESSSPSPSKFDLVLKFVSNQLTLRAKALNLVTILFFICALIAYLSWSIYCKRFQSEDDIRVVWISVSALLIILLGKCQKYITNHFHCNWISRLKKVISKHKKKLIIFLSAVIIVGLISFLIFFVAMRKPYNLVSLTGILAFSLFCYIFSFNSKKVKWRPVISGLLLQFILALIILRTQPGYQIFDFLGRRVNEFLRHTDAGTSFVFGKEYAHHLIAFKILPNIIFFSSVISMLYYLGAIQMVIRKFAWIMHITMGTTAGESLNAAGNVFVGMAEAPLMIRPLIGKMTNSELHAVMSSGFATIAGNILATYIFFGLSASHLLSASVMSAPAALAMSKLFYPETKKSKTTFKQVTKLSPSPYSNLIEAASGGASESIVLISNIVVNLISFIALFHLVNGTLMWLGDRACLTQPLTFEFVCSYLLWPIPLLMGVDLNDCKKVAYLLGIKVFLNEFIAYEQLSKMITNRDLFFSMNETNLSSTNLPNGDLYVQNDFQNLTLAGGIVSARSEAITIYSLCGFSNIGSVGVTLSSLGTLAPHRRSDLSGMVIRSLIVGNIACFITACIAGLLLDV